MKYLLIAIGVALLFIYLLFRMNNIRTKAAYAFIIIGVLSFSFFGFVIFSDYDVNWENIDNTADAIKGSIFWIGGALTDAIKFTGSAIDKNIKNDDLDRDELKRKEK